MQRPRTARSDLGVVSTINLTTPYTTMMTQTGHGAKPPRGHPRKLVPRPNAVHFAIRMAALKSMRVVGCGVRGRNG